MLYLGKNSQRLITSEKKGKQTVSNRPAKSRERGKPRQKREKKVYKSGLSQRHRPGSESRMSPWGVETVRGERERMKGRKQQRLTSPGLQKGGSGGGSTRCAPAGLRKGLEY